MGTTQNIQNLSKYHGHRNFNFQMCKSARRLSVSLSRSVSINAPNCWRGFFLPLYQQCQGLVALTSCEDRTTTITGAGIPYVAMSGGSTHAAVNWLITPLGTSVNNH
jgi:hypothetical protein